MIIPDDKKAATIILAKRDGNGKETSAPAMPEESLNPEMEGLKAVAEDIMRAINSKSAHDLSQALKAFVEMCDSDDDASPENE